MTAKEMFERSNHTTNERVRVGKMTKKFKHDNETIIFRRKSKSLVVIYKWSKHRCKYKFKATTSKMYDIELFMIDWWGKWDLMSVSEKEIAMNELGKELER